MQKNVSEKMLHENPSLSQSSGTVLQIDDSGMKEELTYGSYIILNLELDTLPYMKIGTDTTVSSFARAISMDPLSYNPKNVFQILPKCSYSAAMEINSIIELGKFPESQLEHEYHNFSNEMQTNDQN